MSSETDTIPVNTTDFAIIMGTLRYAINYLADGRQINPHCSAYGMVAVMKRNDGGPDENYYILFNPAQPSVFKIEAFENKNNFHSGQLVYFYDDKAEAIVQSTLRGESDNFMELE